MPSIRFPALIAAILLISSCTGGDQLGEPWGSPIQFSTALPETPYPPRDLPMFDGVNGRVLMWADLMRLVRRSDVIVVEQTTGDPIADAARTALIEDVRNTFVPTEVIQCQDGADACLAAFKQVPHGTRRVVIQCGPACSVAELSQVIRNNTFFDTVTTVAFVNTTARFLRPDDWERADVVVHAAASATHFTNF